MGVGVGIVKGSVASGKGCRGSEGRIRRAEMGDRRATFIIFRRVGCGHVVEDYSNVFLRLGY